MSLIELFLIIAACILQSYVMVKIVSDMLNDETNFKMIVCIFALILLLKTFLIFFNYIEIAMGVLIIYSGFLIIVLTNYKGSYLKKILGYVTSYLITMIAEIIAVIIILLIGIKYNKNNYQELMLISICISFLQIFIYYLLSQKIKKLIKFLEKLLKRFSGKYGIIAVANVLGILSIIYIFFPYRERDDLSLLFAYIIVVVMISALIFIAYSKSLENINLIRNLEQLNKYNSIFEKILKKQRELTHEYHNDLLLIRENLKSEYTTDAINIIDTILKNVSDNNASQLSKSYSAMSNSMIKQILMYKVIDLDHEHINYIINVSGKSRMSNFNNKNINSYCKCLGIIFDNVLEATQKSKKTPVIIDIKQSSSKIEIEFINRITARKIKKNQDYIHGVGLKILNKIVKRNKFIEYNQEIVNQTYIQQIVLKRNKT